MQHYLIDPVALGIRARQGNHQEIFGTLQKHYGYTKEQVEEAVKDFKSKP